MTGHHAIRSRDDVRVTDDLARELRATPRSSTQARDVLRRSDMAVAKELLIVRMEDIDVFAEARFLFRLAKDASVAAPDAGDGRALGDLRLSAMAIPALVAEALRGRDSVDQLRRYHEALAAIRDLRARVWDAYRAGWIADAVFDDLMSASTRCRLEIEKAERGARDRARRDVDAA
jgi:hypothetical protein